MKQVVLDGYALNPGDLSWKPLENLGNTTIFNRSTESQVNNRIQGASAIFVNKVQITKEHFEKNPQLKYIGVLATGYDIVDIQSAKEHGVVVTNIPSYGTDSVSQHAIALLLEITNRVGYHDQKVKKGAWTHCGNWTFWDYSLIELAGKTMGIIGFGRIGQQTGKVARALNMKVIVNDPYQNPTMIEQGYQYVSLDEIYTQSDVIVLHCNLTEKNREMICKETIAKMVKKPIIINNSRGPLINQQDLVAALRAGTIRAAGLDVLEEEPPSETNPLYELDQCVITPHLSWAPLESRSRLLEQAVKNYQSFLNGKIINQVNLFA